MKETQLTSGFEAHLRRSKNVGFFGKFNNTKSINSDIIYKRDTKKDEKYFHWREKSKKHKKITLLRNVKRVIGYNKSFADYGRIFPADL